MKKEIPFTQDQLANMAKLYREGSSIQAISDIYGISATAVRSRLVAMGVQLRSRGGKHLRIDNVTLRARHLRSEGLKIDTISEMMHISPRSVYRRLALREA